LGIKTIKNARKLLPWEYLPPSNHVFQRINKIFEANQTIQNVNDVIGM
jgi:hypothetical protein